MNLINFCKNKERVLLSWNDFYDKLDPKIQIAYRKAINNARNSDLYEDWNRALDSLFRLIKIKLQYILELSSIKISYINKSANIKEPRIDIIIEMLA
jgi:hypothetical protein